MSTIIFDPFGGEKYGLKYLVKMFLRSVKTSIQDRTHAMNSRKLLKNPGKLVKNPENFEELTKIEESSHLLLNK